MDFRVYICDSSFLFHSLLSLNQAKMLIWMFKTHFLFSLDTPAMPNRFSSVQTFATPPNTCGVLFCFVFLLVLSTTCHMVREGFPSDSLPGKVQRTELRGVFIFLSIMVYHRIFFLKICLFTYFGCGGSLLLH